MCGGRGLPCVVGGACHAWVPMGPGLLLPQCNRCVTEDSSGAWNGKASSSSHTNKDPACHCLPSLASPSGSAHCPLGHSQEPSSICPLPPPGADQTQLPITWHRPRGHGGGGDFQKESLDAFLGVRIDTGQRTEASAAGPRCHAACPGHIAGQCPARFSWRIPSQWPSKWSSPALCPGCSGARAGTGPATTPGAQR